MYISIVIPELGDTISRASETAASCIAAEPTLSSTRDIAQMIDTSFLSLLNSFAVVAREVRVRKHAREKGDRRARCHERSNIYVTVRFEWRDGQKLGI